MVLTTAGSSPGWSPAQASPQVISSQADLPRRTHQRWTAEEDEHLRAAFGTTRSAEIARQLKRTRAAVAQRALKVLRLPRKRTRPSGASWDPNSDAFLHSNYGRIPAKEIAASLHRTVSAVHSRAHIVHLTRRTVRGPNQPWSVDDEQYVLGNYGKVPRAELAKRMHRTPAAISGRASKPRWGLAAPRRSRKDWTPREDAILRSGYGNAPIQSISHVLRRTISSIHSRAHKLGLTRPTMMASRRDWTGDEDDGLRSMYGKIRPAEIARKIGRTRPSVYRRAERLGLV